jgi:hypothetical protein
MKILNSKRNAWTAAAAAVVLTVAVTATACNSNSGNNAEHAQQQADTASLENNQPLPHFNYSQERQNMIDIETMEADDVQTTSFFLNMGDPDPVGSCPSIGFGIPDSASLSNPLQTAGGNNDTNIGQMDPTGIYAPVSSMGTFVICLTLSGQPYINRIESSVDTYGGPAEWNYTKHTAQMNGAPTAAAKLVSPAKAGK